MAPRAQKTKAPTTIKPPTRWPKLIRIILARPKLFGSLVVGAAVTAAAAFLDVAWLPSDPLLRWLTQGLLGWDVAVVLYLGRTYWTFAHSDIDHIRQQSALQDEGRLIIPIVTITVAAVSLAVIFYWLNGVPRSETRQPFDLTLLLSTILLSWAFIHTIFALHYAHEFYAEHRGPGGGLHFPGGGKPNYWDFVYFSFGVGMTSQVSDVTVRSRTIRSTVTVHSIIAFVFNVAVIALTVNVAAAALSTSPAPPSP